MVLCCLAHLPPFQPWEFHSSREAQPWEALQGPSTLKSSGTLLFIPKPVGHGGKPKAPLTWKEDGAEGVQAQVAPFGLNPEEPFPSMEQHREQFWKWK